MEDSNKNYGSGVQALLTSLRFSFFLMAAGILAAVSWYVVFGGSFTPGTRESVLLLRFGKIYGIYTQGWHWAMPAPIDQVVRIPATKQTLRSRSFWYREKPESAGKKPNQPSLMEYTGGPLKPGLDGYLLTGDENIIHAIWGLEYRISDPLRFYKSVALSESHDPKASDFTNADMVAVAADRLVKTVFDQVIASVTASQKVDGALYGESKEYRDEVEAGVIRRLATLDLGVTVENVMLEKKSPPLSAVAAFASVASAENELDTFREKARSYAMTSAEQADAEAARVKAMAQAYRERVVSEISSEKNYFESMLATRGDSNTVLVGVYTDTLAEILGRVGEKYYLRSKGGGGQELRLMLNRPQREEANQ